MSNERSIAGRSVQRTLSHPRDLVSRTGLSLFASSTPKFPRSPVQGLHGTLGVEAQPQRRAGWVLGGDHVRACLPSVCPWHWQPHTLGLNFPPSASPFLHHSPASMTIWIFVASPPATHISFQPRGEEWFSLMADVTLNFSLLPRSVTVTDGDP